METIRSGVDDLLLFRQQLHSCFDKRADALFELTDAILSTGTVPSPPHLSLAPIHRRGWGSLFFMSLTSAVRRWGWSPR